MRKLAWVILLAAFGCKGRAAAPAAKTAKAAPAVGAAGQAGKAAPAAQARNPACASRAAAFRTWLAALYNPAHKMKPPWPTGDAALDANIARWRAEARRQAKPANAAVKQPRLAPGIHPRKLEADLAGCPAAEKQLVKESKASPNDRAAIMIGLADAIAGCGCKVDFRRLEAELYLGQRGPD